MNIRDREPSQKYSDNPTQFSGFRVIEDAIYGFRRLDPIPPEAQISEFYESHYYDLIRKGNRVPELRRLMEGGNIAEQELRWLRDGPYTDIMSILSKVAPGRRLLEVGCGTGHFLAFANELGFSCEGTEPSVEAAQRGASMGLSVHNMTLEKFTGRFPSSNFDVVVMMNVLEHVPDAVKTVQLCGQVLGPGGILCIRVPNDFSEMQMAAKEKLCTDPWWIAVPDHINYFNFESLMHLLDRLGFETVCAQGDFPMEMFLLMGDNYVGNSQVGGACHARRVQFELGLSADLRRKIYSALGKVGVGRNCLVFGKKVLP
jgi:2-polyprenyl-3-methyl-5-hydroxy-6-metoxy-1,4-benzoquinol methylase